MRNIRLPTKNGDIVTVAVLLALSCVFFYKVLLNPGGIIFDEYFSDVLELFLPYKSLVHETWQSFGQLPLWNPYTFMGTPAIGNVVYAMFNPYNVLFMLFDPAWLFGALFMVDVFVIGVSTYFFVKSIGVNRFGAMVAAITFMFSGVVIARVYAGHPANLDIIAMVPLSFLLIEVAMQRKSLFYGMLAGIPICLQLVGGNIQVALYGLTALGLYFVFRLFSVINKNPKDAPKMLGIMVLAGLVGISLAAVQLAPSFELSLNSVRNVADSIDYETATAYSFPPEQTLTFLMPEFFGTYLDYTYWGGRNFWELCVYTGVFSIVLTIVALIGVKNKYKTIFLLLLAFSFLFALGKYSPLYSAFYYFPFFNMFRKPSVMLFLTAFSLSVLSGFGADFLARNLDLKHRKRLSILIKVLAVSSILAVVVTLSAYAFRDTIMSFGKQLLMEKYEYFTTYVHTLPYELEFYTDKIPDVYSRILNGMIAFLAILSSITALLYLEVKKKIKVKYFQLAVILIILLDLWWFGMKYIDVIGTETVFKETPVMAFLKNETQEFRVVNIPGAVPQYMLRYYDIETMGGYEPVQLGTYENFTKYLFGGGEEKETGYSFSNINEDMILNNTKLLGMLNVKYVLTQKVLDAPDFALKQNITTQVHVKSLSNYKYKSNRGGYLLSNTTTQTYIYENRNFLPRAFVVRNAEVSSNDDALGALGRKDFDPKDTIILEKDVGVPLNNPGAYKQADIAYYSPNEIRVQVYMDNPGFLVLSENYYPGWIATDNGKETEIYRADYILRAVYLNEGQHTVNFMYNPASFKFGGSITIITLLAMCTLVLYKIKSKLRRDGAK